MLAHPTLELLHALGLHGMAKGYKEIDANPEARSLAHTEWLGLLLEHEMTLRRQKRFETRARAACALGHKACREDLSVLYYRMPRLFAALGLARGDGRYGTLLRQLAKVNLLVLDDWGPEPLLAEQARDLLEIVEDRYEAGSILITSQLPVDRWYDIIGIPTLADAVLDRVVHNAYRIELSGESLRKRQAPATTA
jgi:hypothetical protein